MNLKRQRISGKAHEKVRWLLAGAAFCMTAHGIAGNGLSNEIILNKQWHDLDFSRSLIINPSFAAPTRRPTVGAALSTTQWGAFFIMNSQVTIPVSSTMKKSQTVGISYTGFSSGSFEQTRWLDGRIAKDDGEIKYTEHYGTVTYSLMPFRFMAAGINVNVARQSNFNHPIIDASMDLGVSFYYEGAKLGRHILGISLLNPARFSRFEIPVYTPDIGMSWDITAPSINKDLTMVGGIDANFRSFWGENFSYPRKDVAARIGINIRDIITCYLQGGRYYFGVSGKIDLDAGMKPLALQFKNSEPNGEDEQKGKPYQFHKASAAYQILNTEKQIRPTNTLYLSGEFGKERDEGDDCFKMYRTAKQLFESCLYWEAYGYFSIIERDCPGFPKIDEVRVLSAYCLERLHQDSLAVAKYKNARDNYHNKSAYNDGVVMGAADLGLFRLYAKGENVSLAEDRYNQLKRSAAYDTIKQYADYLYGLFKMRQEESGRAVVAFNSVDDENHPVYPFAQYSKGVCLSSESEADDDVKKSFKNVIGFEKRIDERHARCNEADAQREIISKAKYALASHYYEKYRGNVKNLKQCDDIRLKVARNVGDAISLADGGKCAYSLTANNDPQNLVQRNTVISGTIGRSILTAFISAVKMMTCKDIGMNFRTKDDSLVIRIDNLSTGWIRADNSFQRAISDQQVRAALENSISQMALRSVDLHLNVAAEGIISQFRPDSLKVTVNTLVFKKQAGDTELSRTLNNLISIYRQYDVNLNEALEHLDSIPMASRWGADMLYLSAWVYFQQKQWIECLGSVALLESRYNNKEYDDVKSYMMADGMLLKATSMVNDRENPMSYNERKLQSLELYNQADSIMSVWLSSLNLTDGARINSLLETPEVFEVVLHDSLMRQYVRMKLERDSVVLSISKTVQTYNAELYRDGKIGYYYKGKDIESLIQKFKNEIERGDAAVKKVGGLMEKNLHCDNYIRLIIGIMSDIKASTFLHNKGKRTAEETGPAQPAQQQAQPAQQQAQPAQQQAQPAQQQA
ncbi:MAG: hypothetical protein JW913_12720, partial [Chitinispirillaceae bacterium]|nr:hypothetical protein [Chitinispirillaceae bacterium]